MKLTASRETTIGDVEPGELIASQDGDGARLIIDEVRRRRDSIEVYCIAEGSSSTRRSMLPFKSLDEKITVEAGVEDGTEILETLTKLIAPPSDTEKWPYDKAGAVLQLTIGTRVQGKTAGRVWTVTFEA